MMGSERRLLDVVYVHLDLMIPQAKVKLSEEASALEFIEQLLHHWNRKFVSNRVLVESPLINTETPR